MLEPLLPGQLGEGRFHWTLSPALPILSLFPEVIGVAELVNKINGPWFSKFDEDLATAFSIYCGISIAHVREHDWAGRVASYSPHWLFLLWPVHAQGSDPSEWGVV